MAEKAEGVVALMAKIALDIVSSPLNLALVAVCGALLYKIVTLKRHSVTTKPREPDLPKLKKRDFTLEQIREYDGTGAGGRILVAVNGKVFDVTRAKRFYGQGGPYSAFAGRDASRGLATFSIATRDEYDDLSDLNTMQMDSVREWEMQFTGTYLSDETYLTINACGRDNVGVCEPRIEEIKYLNAYRLRVEMVAKKKYDYVGRLLKPGEEPNDYSEDDDCSQSGTKVDEESKEEIKSDKTKDD